MTSMALPGYTLADLGLVCHINSFEDFFLQRLTDIPALLDLQTKLQVADLVPLDRDENCDDDVDLIMARYPVDGLLYRASILDTSGKIRRISFIDFGNEELIAEDDCFVIPDGLVSHPPLATRCALLGLYEVRGREEEARETFRHLTLEKEVLVEELGGWEGQTWMVDLMLKDGEWLNCSRKEVNSARNLLLCFGLGVLEKDLIHKISEPSRVAIDQFDALKPETVHFARIATVESPIKFSLQLLGVGNPTGEDLLQMIHDLKVTYSTYNRLLYAVICPWVGQFVVVHKPSLGYFRAQIVQLQTKMLITVRYMDSGLREVVSVSDTYRMLPHFQSFPALAIDVQLHGIEATLDADGAEVWPKGAFKIIRRFANKEYLWILVKERMGPKFISEGEVRANPITASVIVYKPTSMEILAERLVKRKYAKRSV